MLSYVQCMQRLFSMILNHFNSKRWFFFVIQKWDINHLNRIHIDSKITALLHQYTFIAPNTSTHLSSFSYIARAVSLWKDRQIGCCTAKHHPFSFFEYINMDMMVVNKFEHPHVIQCKCKYGSWYAAKHFKQALSHFQPLDLSFSLFLLFILHLSMNWWFCLCNVPSYHL